LVSPKKGRGYRGGLSYAGIAQRSRVFVSLSRPEKSHNWPFCKGFTLAQASPGVKKSGTKMVTKNWTRATAIVTLTDFIPGKKKSDHRPCKKRIK
jgi:hypothetical protein